MRQSDGHTKCKVDTSPHQGYTQLTPFEIRSDRKGKAMRQSDGHTKFKVDTSPHQGYTQLTPFETRSDRKGKVDTSLLATKEHLVSWSTGAFLSWSIVA